MDHSNHYQGQSYVLTFNLGQEFQIIEKLGLESLNPDHPIFQEIITGLEELTLKAFPGIDLLSIDVRDWTKKIVEKIPAGKKVVNLSAEIKLAGSYLLEVNRLFHPADGRQLGVGSRPGKLSLSHQTEELRKFLNGQSAVLVEDGTFTGKTMVNIIKNLKEQEVTIDMVVVGLSFPGALEKVREVIDNITVIHEIENPLDWIPDHDFIPFAPGAGKVVGLCLEENNGCLYPLYNHMGTSFSVPFVLPFAGGGLMEKWTNYPESRVKEISAFCLEKTIELFEELENLNGCVLETSEIANPAIRISFPWQVGNGLLPEPKNGRVVDFLMEKLIQL